MTSDAAPPEKPEPGDRSGEAGLEEMVVRQRLLRRLGEDRHKTLIVCAPSGYGKTVLLEQLAELDRRSSHVVLLRPQDNDPAVLVRSIIGALEGSEPFPEEIADALQGPKPDFGNVVTPRLLAGIGSRESPFLLILDELEQIEAPDSLAIVAALVRGVPAGSQLAIATRVEPPLRLGRLRANRRLIELGREELTMTKGECAALLASIGVELPPRQLDTIVLRTEGWPAALYLAGLALAEAADTGRALSRFAGDDRVVVDYLREEFLLPVSRPRLEFLTRASVLERLSGELCDAVLERDDSATILAELASSNMLLIRLDRTDGWYRFHPLLRDMLRSELHRTEGDVERDLHVRASEWWSANGDWDQAIDHAIEAVAVDRAGELLWTAVPEYVPRGRLATVTSCLQRLGEKAIATSPGLSLTAAWTEITMGHGSLGEHWTGVAKRALATGPPSELSASFEAGLSLAEATLARDGLAAMRESVAAVEPALEEDDPWRTICCLLDGVGLHLLGDSEPARERLREGVRRGSVGAPNVQCLCLAQLGLLYIDQGDRPVAEREILRAREQIERYGLGDYPMIAVAFAASALVRAKRGSTDAAIADLAAGQRLLGELDHFLPWFEIEASVTLARAALRLGDRERAMRLAGTAAADRLSEVADAAVPRRWVEELEAAFRSGTPTDDPLTAAELRVLQFLPSHLSFPQVAASVNVSPNTVKTHVRSIYRKLGATSRQEAIERAQRAGLLDGSPVVSGRDD
jgi:LuxR family maltose regulon positive regulatory protein